MNQPGHEPHPSPPPGRRTGSSTRRIFLKRAIGGLAVAIPAWRVLSGTAPAAAATPGSCDAGCPPPPCSKVYLQYEGHHCASSNPPNDTCQGPDVAHCIGTYFKISSYNGQYCGTVYDDEGYCSE